MQIGLGGDNSWYRIIVHEPYLTPLTRDYDYAYIPVAAFREGGCDGKGKDNPQLSVNKNIGQ